jgi:hypothetical protein
MSWYHSEGPRGFKVTVFATKDSPNIQAYMRDRSKDKVDPFTEKIIPGYSYKSLKHSDREKAIEWARSESARWVLAKNRTTEPVPTLRRVLDLYVQHRTPAKVESEQDADRRRGKMWKKRLGANKDLRELRRQEWDAFVKARRSGEIDAEGNVVAVEDRRPVRDGTIWGDLVFLHSVINFAVDWKEEDGKFVMESNPARGFPMVKEKNPRRPISSQDRLEAILKVASKVHPFLSPILTIVNGTGRRIMAVIQLRFQDLVLAKTKDAPHGAVQWPGETDKMGKAWAAPISARVREVIDTILSERPGVGSLPLFPSSDDPTKVVSRYIADRWLTTAEKLAGVPKHRGSLWHAYRRKWATERKHLPDVDVAAAGGWSDPTTLKVYQQTDTATLLAVVEGGRELREAKA